MKKQNMFSEGCGLTREKTTPLEKRFFNYRRNQMTGKFMKHWIKEHNLLRLAQELDI